MVDHNPMYYYVMNNDCVKDNQVKFDRPDYHMKSHLKPLFTQAKINNIGVNKVLLDGGAAVNLLPQSLLKKIGLSKSDLKPHNVVLSNYEGKSGSSFGAVEVDLVVGTIKQQHCFWWCLPRRITNATRNGLDTGCRSCSFNHASKSYLMEGRWCVRKY